MQLAAQDISVFAFAPDDGSDSAAVKVLHRTARHEVINNETASQVQNFRHALVALFEMMNPNPDHIPVPGLMIYDPVRVTLPQSIHEGQITEISWDFKRSEWKYFVKCPNEVVSTWYVGADLQVLGEDF